MKKLGILVGLALFSTAIYSAQTPISDERQAIQDGVDATVALRQKGEQFNVLVRAIVVGHHEKLQRQLKGVSEQDVALQIVRNIEAETGLIISLILKAEQEFQLLYRELGINDPDIDSEQDPFGEASAFLNDFHQARTKNE